MEGRLAAALCSKACCQSLCRILGQDIREGILNKKGADTKESEEFTVFFGKNTAQSSLEIDLENQSPSFVSASFLLRIASTHFMS